MCGIAGIAAWNPVRQLEGRVLDMTNSLVHRGPDDSGMWFDEEQGIGLSHRRLAIVDLSPAGHQPMRSASGRYVFVFNGEIYNAEAMRADLVGSGRAPAWRGHSDTEVLLAGFDAWGVEDTIRRATGMFAFALWDRSRLTLTLGRDRLGEKPLHYCIVDGKLFFASELKAIRAALGDRLVVDRGVLSTFLQFGYVPSPLTIYRDVHKLPPGHTITFSGTAVLPEAIPFWRLVTGDHMARLEQASAQNDMELLDRLHDKLNEAVAGQSISDVPLGAFLSGGVDSSLVVALMQAQSRHPVRTFTIGFKDAELDEAPFARAVARHLGTDHTEIYVSAKDATDVIPMLPNVYDEPFADSSQIPTILVSRMTRQHVTVALSGDGGDELFAGYPRYRIVATLWQRMARWPLPMRSAAAAILAGPSAHTWDILFSALPSRSRREINGRRMHRLAESLRTESLQALYVRLMSRVAPEDLLVREAPGMAVTSPSWVNSFGPIDAMRVWDLGQYLPDDLMVKVDRASMSASLETRAPFLDHRVVEFALTLPQRLLLRGREGKWALRQLLDRYVPRALIDRPKAGFEVPLAAWLRGPLRPWAESLLDKAKVAAQGYLDEDQVCAMWRQHLSGEFDRSQPLWHVLMFQSWLESTQKSASAGAGRANALSETRA